MIKRLRRKSFAHHLKSKATLSTLVMWSAILLLLPSAFKQSTSSLATSVNDLARDKAATRVATKRAPNIVFILIDDLGWADLGCYGSTFNRTPHIDSLAARGMRFTDAYAAAPVCSPSRASLLTGKYPARLHLTDWLPGREDSATQKLLRPVIRQELPLHELTIAEALKPAGYVSASIGKWHLGGKGYGPEEQGFDLNIAGDHNGVPLSYFYPYKSGRETAPGLERGRPGEYITDRLTDEAEKFIERNRTRPFFLYLAHFAVHIPMKAKPEIIAKYQRAAVQSNQTQTNPIYAAMLESVDESVGRVMSKLEQLNLTDDTLVFIASDNGGLSVEEGPHTPATSNAPLRAGKGYLYEGGIRVPLIVYRPGMVRPHSLSRTPVSSADFFPTILDAAGLKPTTAVDGVSLLPLLMQSGAWSRTSLYWHYPHYSNQGGRPGGAIREGDYKLIEFFEDNRLELYDLERDPSETADLAAKMPEKARELQAKLQQWRARVGAQMMSPNLNYHAASASHTRIKNGIDVDD